MRSASLLVQTADEGEPITVALHDAYLLPPRRAELSVGDYAICREDKSRWIPCRIDHAEGGRIVRSSADGERASASPDGVLEPTPVTRLNLQRHFERAAARTAFQEALRAAGSPRAPPGWTPERGERVVANVRSRWYAARVAGVEDDEWRVVWEGTQRSTHLSADSIVPVPPHDFEPAPGRFVLRPPPSGAQPWQPARIEAIDKDDLIVVDENGERYRMDARDVLPLIPG